MARVLLSEVAHTRNSHTIFKCQDVLGRVLSQEPYGWVVFETRRHVLRMGSVCWAPDGLGRLELGHEMAVQTGGMSQWCARSMSQAIRSPGNARAGWSKRTHRRRSWVCRPGHDLAIVSPWPYSEHATETAGARVCGLLGVLTSEPCRVWCAVLSCVFWLVSVSTGRTD